MNTSLSNLDCSTRSISPPDDYICPISMSVMRHPMLNKKTGHRYERESIMEWLYRGNTKCPLTRKRIHPDDLVLDIVLQTKINTWKLEQKYEESVSDDIDDDSSSSGDDDEFDSAFDDIMAITDRIRDATLRSQQRRVAASTPSTATPVAPAAPTLSNNDNRLQDIRLRVLQLRDDRIKNFMAKTAPETSPSGSNNADTMSLSHLMIGRI